MSFEIENFTTAKLLDVVVLSQKNREPDQNPGAKLSLELAMGNDALVLFDGHLKGMLFTKSAAATTHTRDKQGSLEGIPVVSDTPNLTAIGQKVGQLHWEHELTGYGLTIDYGIGGASSLEVADCKLSNFRILPKEGGTVLIKLDVESQDVPEKAFGKLATLKTRDIKIILTPPEVTQDDVDEKPQSRRGRSKSRELEGASA